jgi:sec-independent protein translocase protein TatC
MDEKLTLVEHLEELRYRAIKSVVAVIAATCLLYSFVEEILPHLIKPAGILIFIAPSEAFISRIKIAFFGGLFLSSPIILYQIWKFVSSGLRRNERRYILLFGPLSFIFLVMGALFGYFIIVPIGMRFLLSFATDLMIPMITVSSYISFLGLLTLSFGIIFELPLASLFLTKIGIVNPGFLSSRRKHAIVLIFIVAAILTPPDIITQCLMALPLLVLYEISILFSRFVYK